MKSADPRFLAQLQEELADLHEFRAKYDPYDHRAIAECECSTATSYRVIKHARKSRPKVLCLDDDAARVALIEKTLPDAEVVWAKTVQKARDLFPTAEWAMILLDHDLQDWQEVDGKWREATGADFAKWLSIVDHSRFVPIFIHSQNLAGSERMHRTLYHGGWRNIDQDPFSDRYLERLARAWSNLSDSDVNFP